ncbi:Cullin binding-domain-containing protein [Panaeolus papilionaceus]|nr:Cullin binding-domain-containing protein [Panaeolus papilionaceus]
MVDKKYDTEVAQFCSITGASARDARKFVEHYKRLDMAMDAYYNNPNQFRSKSSSTSTAPSTAKIEALFQSYKDPDGDEITIDGTIKLCADLEVDPEDVVLLAVAYELKSPRVGEWTRKGWVDGWKSIGCVWPLQRLKERLASDSVYFKSVYGHTFDFARSEGQRSLGLETALAFWNLLLPHGYSEGALTTSNAREGNDDVDMDGNVSGWKEEYTQWWFEFLTEKKLKGVSKDTWLMFLDFVRSINANFSNYDENAAWPSTIDDFVEYAKEKLKAGA